MILNPLKATRTRTVTALCETGRNETDFYIVIKLDEASMRQPEISRCCPEGIMRCFPWTVSPEEKPEKKAPVRQATVLPFRPKKS